MTMMLYFFTLSMTISTIIMTLTLMLGKKTTKLSEKLSPFECGFDPFKKARIPFSLRFFLITILFLIFDVEVAILLPLGLFSFNLNSFSYFSSTVIMGILILGLFHEWNQGALNWLN
uniref:NADH-ubiquinone oxidoreductase chain 3 n=1 Tax=Pseudoniphargus stocki TaxID=2211535 RepID=A0A345K5T2_9CRUS|nr:NADH dehydrogenase subunit 3 [Pseudoniphargus stocki]AXH38224.1 NADH dehydrogenase subunit 3 [Pseudoniphargus stocki]